MRLGADFLQGFIQVFAISHGVGHSRDGDGGFVAGRGDGAFGDGRLELLGKLAQGVCRAAPYDQRQLTAREAKHAVAGRLRRAEDGDHAVDNLLGIEQAKAFFQRFKFIQGDKHDAGGKPIFVGFQAVQRFEQRLAIADLRTG